MSNGSLKEQLQAVAGQWSDKSAKPTPPKRQFRSVEKVQKPKPKWLDYAQYGVELLRVYFPNAFKSPNEIKPLQKGIKEELVKRLSTLSNIVTDDKACMVKSLAYYVNTAYYHKSVVAGAKRVDLDGNPAGDVTAEEEKYSKERQEAKRQAKKSPTAATTFAKKEPTA